jgi:nitrate reductase cytochrome c-type subunit
MSESHYTRVDGNWQSANARYVCVQCHTPQAEVKELVGNTFAQ